VIVNVIYIREQNGEWVRLGWFAPPMAESIVSLCRSTGTPYELTMHVEGRCPFYTDHAD
jgi:hypothetical protein